MGSNTFSLVCILQGCTRMEKRLREDTAKRCMFVVQRNSPQEKPMLLVP